MTITYAGKHRSRSDADLKWPHIQTVNAQAAMLTGRPDTLYVSLTDATTHNGLGIDFAGDALDAIREALTPRREGVATDPFVRTEDMIPPPFDAVAWAIHMGVES